MKFLIFLLLGLTACTTSDPVLEVAPQAAAPKAQQALDDLYQKGKSARIQGLADDCLKTFNKLIDLRKTRQDSLFAYSLYQSGLCYEMKNEFDRAIAVYQDALRVRAVVNSELTLLEI